MVPVYVRFDGARELRLFLAWLVENAHSYRWQDADRLFVRGEPGRLGAAPAPVHPLVRADPGLRRFLRQELGAGDDRLADAPPDESLRPQTMEEFLRRLLLGRAKGDRGGRPDLLLVYQGCGP